jgi:hypothetical protein
VVQGLFLDMADFSKLPPEKKARMCKVLVDRYKRCVGNQILENPLEVTDKCGGIYLDLTDLCGDNLAVSVHLLMQLPCLLVTSNLSKILQALHKHKTGDSKP